MLPHILNEPLFRKLWVHRRSFLGGEQLLDTGAGPLFLTSSLSLVTDYVDVTRYLSGDRS